MTDLAIGAEMSPPVPPPLRDEDGDGDLRVVGGGEADEPVVVGTAVAVLRCPGLAGDLDAGDLRAAVPVPLSTTLIIISVSWLATSAEIGSLISSGSVSSTTERSGACTWSTR